MQINAQLLLLCLFRYCDSERSLTKRRIDWYRRFNKHERFWAKARLYTWNSMRCDKLHRSSHRLSCLSKAQDDSLCRHSVQLRRALQYRELDFFDICMRSVKPCAIPLRPLLDLPRNSNLRIHQHVRIKHNDIFKSVCEPSYCRTDRLHRSLLQFPCGP